MSHVDYTVACLARHGTGPELMAEASRAIHAASLLHGFSVAEEHVPFGTEALMRFGHPFPSAARRSVLASDAVLVPPGKAEPLDVVNYVRRIEESLIKVCAGLGLDAGRVDGRSGVWLPAGGGRPARKVGAIGVRVSRATTLHGFALNCDCDLSAFGKIVPCGITDAEVTSVSAELGYRVGVDDVRSAVAEAVCDALDGRLVLNLPTYPAPQPAVPAGIVTEWDRLPARVASSS